MLPKLNSVLKVLLDFLHFAKDFAQNHTKEMGQYKNIQQSSFPKAEIIVIEDLGQRLNIYIQYCGQKKLANLNLVNHLHELMSRVLTRCRQGHPSSDSD